jgi:hypothetical protein
LVCENCCAPATCLVHHPVASSSGGCMCAPLIFLPTKQ